MNRRHFLASSVILPAALSLGAPPARASTQGATLLETTGFSSSGSFEIATHVPGQPGALDMVFTNGPRVAARLGVSAIDNIAGAQAGDRISILYVGFNSGDTVTSIWTLNQVSAAGARAQFDANGLAAEVSSIVGGAQYSGAGLAGMIVAALSAGTVVRQGGASALEAVIATRRVGGNFAFGLDVTVRSA
jgi:hypothetical protein